MGSFLNYYLFGDDIDPFEGWALITEAIDLDGVKGDDVIHHATEIGGHRLQVMFNAKGPRHYSVDYKYRGTFDRPGSAEALTSGKRANEPVHPDTAKQVLHHVAAVVHHFKSVHKPKALTFTSNNDPEKSKVYHAFAKHMAKTHNGVALKPKANSGFKNWVDHSVRFKD